MKQSNYFQWDFHSDQPYPLRDKKFKQSMGFRLWADHLKMVYTNVLHWPRIFWKYLNLPEKVGRTEELFGMGVDCEKNPGPTIEMIDDLGVDHLLVRFPLEKIDRIKPYLAFIQQLQGKNVVVNLLQSRALIEDQNMLKKYLTSVFHGFSPWVKSFQIGNAVNRSKWGFFSLDEYLRFYETAYNLKEQHFKGLNLIGPSIIDFEYHQTLRALFNTYPIRFDQVSSLLYVDRRGAPENKQMGMDLREKIKLLAALVSASSKSGQEILITETNWPLAGTAPYAPTSNKECVSEETYTNYMLRYYLLCLLSGWVKTVYWHQLIAPGYGLVDNRDGLRKRSAYYAYKNMVKLLKGAQLVSYSIDCGCYQIKLAKDKQQIEALWSLRPKKIFTSNCLKVNAEAGFDRGGFDKIETSQEIALGEEVVYLIRGKKDY